MATPESTRARQDATLSAEADDRELRIDIWPDFFADYEGTSAQLLDEGLIPQEFEWPSGRDSKKWSANGFDYWLQRTRPEGHKGPMRSWLALDNWRLRVTVTGRDHYWRVRRDLERKTEALEAEFYRYTEAGSREWDANWKRYWASREDERFQAFKALIPGLIPQKRSRKGAHHG